MTRWNLTGGLLAVVVAGTACHSMTPLSWAELEGIRPSRVWITRSDQTVVEVSGPQVFGDTLVGYVNGEFQEMATADLRRAVMRRPARAKTIGVAVAGIAVTAGLMAMMAGGDRSINVPALPDCNDVPDDPYCQGQGPPPRP
jgi:hypothetical protein